MEKQINPLTIIKVGTKDYKPTPEDLERWHQLFIEHKVTIEGVKAHPHLTIETIPNVHSNRLMLVKIGDEYAKPGPADLEHWRKIFEEAKDDPDFKIFTNSSIEIEIINFDLDGKIIIDE